MARFNYTAEKGDGELYSGTAQAPDRFELYQVIRREGGRLVHLEERGQSMLSMEFWNSKFSTVPEQEKILFARNLGAMLTAGLSLSRALSVLERQTKNARLNAAIGEMESDVRHGATFHDALAKYPGIFPKLMTAMVRAGEEGGGLPDALAVVSDQMDRMHDLKKKIKGAMIYPSIILIAIVGIGFLLMTQVVPTLAKTFKEMGADLPHSTKIIIGISDFLTQYTFFALGLLVLVVGLFYVMVHSKQGKRAIDFVLVHTPSIGGIVREINAARTSRTLASLLQSGVDVLSSLEITHDVVQNSLFQDIIKEARDAVSEGEQLSSVFLKHQDLFPTFVGEMMAVGEETGATAEMLKRLAVYYENEVDRKMKDMSTIIEPFLMLIIGGAVGFFAIAMIQPIYSLSNTIN